MTHGRQTLERGHLDAPESRFGCGHYLLLELAFWIICAIVWAALRPLLTPTVVLILVGIGAAIPLVAALLVVTRDSRRHSGTRRSEQALVD